MYSIFMAQQITLSSSSLWRFQNYTVTIYKYFNCSDAELLITSHQDTNRITWSSTSEYTST